jgi:hypothetical protein
MMTPDHLALLTVTNIGKSVALSAMPNAPVIDDSHDRQWGARLTAARMRLAEMIWPGEVKAPASLQPAELAGC